jgi:LAO/AO transport system kinase
MRAAAEIEAIALGTVKLRFGQVHGSAALDAAAARVVASETDPYSAAEELVASL